MVYFDWGVLSSILAFIDDAIASAFRYIGTFITSVLNTLSLVIDGIQTLVSWILGKIGTVVTTIAGWVASSVTWIAGTIASAVSSFGGKIIPAIGNSIKIAFDVICTAIGWAEYKILVLAEKFKKLLDAIHFKTILAIHQILELVLPQYRKMMKKVYGEIAAISEAIGLGTHFLTLALRNSRNLVLDFTTAIGHSYDMAEIQWLSNMGEFFKSMEGRFEEWKNDPEAVFNSLAEFIDRPNMDGKASFLGSVWVTVDGIINETVKITAAVEKVTGDFEKLLLDLPETIRKRIPPELFEGINALQKSIVETVRPRLDGIDKLITQYADEIRKIRAEAAEAAKKILTPKQIFQEVDISFGVDREFIRKIMEKFDLETAAIDLGVFADVVKPVIVESSKMLEIPEPPKPPPNILTLEFEAPAVPRVGIIPSTTSPFVGDF